jgi:hypothetical protein
MKYLRLIEADQLDRRHGERRCGVGRCQQVQLSDFSRRVLS